MSIIYENVVEVAKKKKIPLYKIEKEAGLAPGAISKWKYNCPRTDNLLAVANVLGTTIGRLTRKSQITAKGGE